MSTFTLFISQDWMLVVILLLMFSPSDGSHPNSDLTLVVVSRREVPKLLTAVLAVVGFFTRMNPHMSCKLMLLSKLTATLCALK